MNVLIATDANVERSGVCLFVFNWIKEARKIKQIESITVYFRKTSTDEKLLDEFLSLNINVVTGELPQLETSLKSSNRKKVRKDIRDILNQNNYDVVHINSSAVGFTFLVLLESVRKRIPIRISHSHGRNLNNGLKNIYLWLLKFLNKRLSTKLAGCSLDAGYYLFGKTGVKSKKWRFVANTIDAEKFRFSLPNREKIRNELLINDNEIVLGTVGTINKRKNHIFLLDIVSELIKEKRSVKLIIVGDGDLKSELIKRIDELKIESNVIFYGATSNVFKVLSAFDIFLLPSLTEGLPISAVEAQANGLPCILSNQIPLDVKILNNLFFLPIDSGYSRWVDKIIELSNETKHRRESYCDIVKNKGFDNSSIFDYICDLYDIRDINIGENKNESLK